MVRLLALSIALATACGASDDGPFDRVTLDGVFEVGLRAPVSVARDKYGVAHIHGRNLRDVAFVQGYVMAHDRLPQMDLLRRFGAGTLAELYGAIDPSTIDTDLEMRMHRMKPVAAMAFQEIQASTDDLDEEVLALLERFADGVNAYADDMIAERWDPDPNILGFAREHFHPWTPVDSLVLGRFQAFALSFTAPFEIQLHELYQDLRAAHSSGPRAGVAADFLTFKPVGLAPTIAGFPDGSTTSDGSIPAPMPVPAALDPIGTPELPHVPEEAFATARSFFAGTIRTGALGALGPHALMRPYAGSNNWAVGPGRTTDGSAILATDQHLQLTNPSIFYPTHLIIDDGDDTTFDTQDLDVMGVTFPGIPGVILGTNGSLAWSATVSEHDVNDVYLEQAELCPGGMKACVRFEGAPVEVDQREEEIRVGALGQIVSTFKVTYEYVPHHGPVIPKIDRATHRLVPRDPTVDCLSIRYTGYDPTFEIRALVRLARARDVVEGFQALSHFEYGSQNWTMIDSGRNIGWTTHSNVPLRPPAAHRWHAKNQPTGPAPFFILPGEGGFEWKKDARGRNVWMPPEYIPHARTGPDVDGGPTFLATANADPVGATFDNDPLNQREVDGRPLYVGVSYAAGVRQERITRGILVDPEGFVRVSREDMEALQHDSRSTVGEKMVPGLRAALELVSDPSGAPTDARSYVNGLSADDRSRLIRARAQLVRWLLGGFRTPAEQDEFGSSAATAIFNTWMHYFIEGALEDELDEIAIPPDRGDPWRLGDNQLFRIAHELLKKDSILSRSTTTGQPILCDNVADTTGDGSCTRLAISAMLAAMKYLESPAGFNTPNVDDWNWGRLHHLTIEPLFPSAALNLPAAGESPFGGFPRAGDNFNVNRADMGWRSLAFSQSADGPAQRFIAVATGFGRIVVRWQLPGGVIFDSRSHHYRDLLDRHYLPEIHFDAPYLTDEIVRDGETRWEFR